VILVAAVLFGLLCALMAIWLTIWMLGDNYFRLTDCFACFLAAAKCDEHVISVPFF